MQHTEMVAHIVIIIVIQNCLCLQDSSSEVVPALTTQSLPASSSQLQISLAIPQGSYLTPGSFITVSIANVTVSSPAEAAGLPATVSPTNGIAQVTVTDQVANIAIGFTAQSLIASVDEGSYVHMYVCMDSQ